MPKLNKSELISVINFKVMHVAVNHKKLRPKRKKWLLLIG